MSCVRTIGLLMLLAVSPGLGYAATVTVRCDDLLLPYSDDPRTGTFDVYVRVVGDGAPDVWGQAVRLELLDAGEGLVLSGVTAPTKPHPYLLPGGEFVGEISDGVIVDAIDLGPPEPVPLTNFAGLARVDFDIAGGIHGEFHFAFDPDLTLLYDDSDNPIPLTLRAATIRVMPLGWIPMPGDANGDELVDEADATILASHWGQASGATWADGDFNEDYKVNDADAAILAAHWQPGESQSIPAPEPGTLALLVSAVLGVFLLRRAAAGRRR